MKSQKIIVIEWILKWLEYRLEYGADENDTSLPNYIFRNIYGMTPDSASRVFRMLRKEYIYCDAYIKWSNEGCPLPYKYYGYKPDRKNNRWILETGFIEWMKEYKKEWERENEK